VLVILKFYKKNVKNKKKDWENNFSFSRKYQYLNFKIKHSEEDLDSKAFWIFISKIVSSGSKKKIVSKTYINFEFLKIFEFLPEITFLKVNSCSVCYLKD